MGMGNHQARQAITAVGNEGRVCHLYRRLAPVVHGAIGSNAARLGKGNAAIHHQPGTVVAIKVEVHTNFAGAAQR